METKSQKSNENIVEYAISKYFEYKSSNMDDSETLDFENVEFPHWNNIVIKMKQLWQKNYAKQLEILSHPNQIDNLFAKFRNDISKIASKNKDYNTFKKYYEIVIENEIGLFRCSNNDSKENNENMNANLLSFNSSKINPVNNMQKSRQIDSKFDMIGMMRCHSKDNDPNDNYTAVNDAAFEPVGLVNFSHFDSFNVINDLQTYTNICATCGGNVINIIDVETCKVVKRFNDDMFKNGSKEVYKKLKWTRMNGMSVLVAGGLHGEIKVILPKYSCCISRFEAHKSSINSILFHYKYPDILLTGSDDNQIKIWRININEAAPGDFECSNQLIGIIEYRGEKKSNLDEMVLDMCFVPNDYLIITTYYSKYFVLLDDKSLFGKECENEMESDDILQYMTTKPANTSIKTLKSEFLPIYGTTALGEPFQDDFTTNKFLFANNFLFANLVNTNSIYVLEINYEQPNPNEPIKLKNIFKIGNISIGDAEATKLNTFVSLYKNDNRYCLLKSTANSLFYVVELKPNMVSIKTALKHNIPSEYVIESLKDRKKISVNNYGLGESPRVITCISNSNHIITTTDQNMIIIWKKSPITQIIAN